MPAFRKQLSLFFRIWKKREKRVVEAAVLIEGARRRRGQTMRFEEKRKRADAEREGTSHNRPYGPTKKKERRKGRKALMKKKKKKKGVGDVVEKARSHARG